MDPITVIAGAVSVLDRDDVDTDQIIPKQFLKGVEDYGFKAIVAPSFADIFYANSTKIGLLPIPLPAEDVEAIMAAGSAHVDLDAQEVTYEGGSARFEIDP